MCVGLPMCVEESGQDIALVRGRGQTRYVRTELVGACEPGDWLLVFLDAAREKLSPQRAAEIDAALDLLEAAMAGDEVRAAREDTGFALPSALDLAALRELTGARH